MKPTTEILARISQNSLANKEEVFTKLYRYLLRPDIYFVAYKNLYANSGAETKGVNEDTADGFSEAKIDSIIKALADETYQPMPVKRVYIQKKNNRKKLRPLGIPTFTDKLVQEVLRMILEAVYEPIFLDVSHGFRPKRSCHTALKQLRREFNGTRWFVEGDIKGCFDNIDHAVLVGLLNNKIKDARITKLIYKFLKAGYSEKGTYGSRRGWHRPTTAMWQGGASLLHHLIFNAVSFADHKHYRSNKRSYHYIRRTSDRLCKEHGLSVIVPGQDRGKSYIEHQAERAGTSYKAKLRAAIDRLLPGCHDLEELLVRLQREGYALKRGKYIFARAPGQERFTRLKTLGADYAEDALTARMAGRARPSRQPKQRGSRVSLLIDIPNNIKAQQSAGYRHWATIENLKRIAETSNFLTEHGIGSMEELTERCEAASASAARLKAELRETGARIEELTLKIKHVAAYRQLKPIYDRYQASKDREKFLRGYEREIILFEAAARECKRLGAVPMPSTARMQAEMDALTARRAALTAERQKARREEQDYAAVRRNVEEFLATPRQAPARQKDMELE